MNSLDVEREYHAIRAWSEGRMVFVELDDGRQIGFPAARFSRLREATTAQLAEVALRLARTEAQLVVRRVEEPVGRLADDIDRHQRLQRPCGIRIVAGAGAHRDLAHMGHVEQAGAGAGMQVFLHHAQWVLHRHVVAGERHHARAQLDVQGMQRGFQQGFGGHIQLLKNVLARR